MNQKKPLLLAMDLEGVLLPEIWINVSRKTGIEALKLTTRDIKDYDELMQYRLKILDEHQLTLGRIQAIIQTLTPLEGAKAFVDWAKANAQLIILSDTFYQFSAPLMAQLGHPTLFCHSLEVSTNDMITGYKLRIKDGKRAAVKNFKELGFHVISVGDSYNDTRMLEIADEGILFNAPDNVIADFPQFKQFNQYAELMAVVERHLQFQPAPKTI